MNNKARKKVSLLLVVMFIAILGIVTRSNTSVSGTNFFSKITSGNFLAGNGYNLPTTVTHFDVEPQSAVTYTKAINETGAQVVGANANVSAIRSIDKTSNQIQYSEDGGTSWKTVSVSYDNRESEWQTDHNLKLNTANLVVEFQIQIDGTWYTVKLDKDTVYPANTYVISNVQNAERLSQLGAKQISYAGSTYYDISGISVFKASNITCPNKSGIDLILSIATILTNQEVNVNVEKTWEGTIPNNAEVTLKLVGVTSSGETFDLSNDYTVTLNQNNNWKHTFTKVSTTSKTGNYILDKFTVEETKVIVNGTDVTEEYKTTITQKDKEQTTQTTNINGTLTTTTIDLYGINIKNTYTPRTTSVTINKIWNDNDNQDGLRNSYKVKLTGIVDNKEVYSDEQELSKDTLTYTWSNILKYYNGKLITYSVDETSVPKGYTKSIDGYNITNTHTPETTSVTINKTWNDNDNQDGIRPKEINVNLYANGTLLKTQKIKANDDGNWSYTFNDLDKYQNGTKITYTITEDSVNGYETEINGYNITNTHTPETTSVTINKTWNDNDNQDGLRNSYKVKLTGIVDNKEVYSDEQELSKDTLTYTWDNLAKYSNGKLVTYSVDETSVPKGYTKSIDGYNITNTHTPDKTSVTINKTWNDNDNQDGIRPEEINVNLYANGTLLKTQKIRANDDGNWTYTFNDLDKYQNGTKITYTITEDKVNGYETEINGYNITNTHTPDKTSVTINKTWNDNDNQDGIRPEEINVNLYANGTLLKTQKIKANDDGNWTYTFNDLDKYQNGTKITYTITEDKVDGYETEINGYNITNTHTPDKTSVTINKTWNDNDNQDGIRPEEINVNLYANGTLLKTQKIKANDDGNWTYTFNDLDKYQNGAKITYTITEDSVNGYETEINGYNITNTHTPITINLPIEKVWLDGNNQDGIRPGEITVNLIADGEKIDTVTITADSEGKWLHTFTKLPKYNNGKEIKYTFSEEAVEGYEVSYKGNIIENTHNPSEKSITVNKVWNDSNNNDGIRPNQIEVKLIGKVGNDEVYSATAIIKEEENWTYTFDKLPEYNNGSIISYTLEETLIEGYTTNIEESEKTFTITNTHEKEQVIISGEKTWDDNDNQDGKRPTTITINLLANGVVVETKEVSADSNGNWTYTFTKDKYQDKEEIKYTLEEVSVEGYTTIIEEGSYNITNYHKPETLTYTINKEWLDDEDNDGIRPDSINVSLLANGEIIQKVVISKENNWTYTFENLPRYANGKVIEYTIIEDELKGYTPSIDYGEYDEDNNSITTDIKNNHEKEKIDDIIIKKIWNDSNSKERPDSIEVIIYANGEYYATITLSSENNWIYTLTNLDKYKNGVLINYTIEEVSVLGYETSYDGYTIINNIIIPAKGGDVEELPPQTGIDNITYENKNGSSEVIMFILLGLLGIKVLKRNY